MKISPRNFLNRYLMVLAVLVFGVSPAFSQVYLSINIAPPPLPIYAQPACPDEGYLWTPGFWAYGEYGYYWVPGTWVQPPQVGVFWTPSYWGWGGNAYVFHAGYWGPNVGFYGGINYGYGYSGNGYGGGRWEGNQFSYNRAVNNVNQSSFHHTYVNRDAMNNNNRNVSYNGGKGGVQAQPTAQERQFSNQRHYQPTSVQQAHNRTASTDRNQLASVNGGRPTTLAAPKPQAYTSIAQQHPKAQPQDRVNAGQATPGKKGGQVSASPPDQIKKQSSQVTPTPRQEVLPRDTPKATVKSHSSPVPTQAPSQARKQTQAQSQHSKQPQKQTQGAGQSPSQKHAPSQQQRQPQKQAQAPRQAQPQKQGQAQGQGQPQNQGHSDKSPGH